MALARDWKLSHKTRYFPSKNRPLHKFGSRRSVQSLECLILGLDGGDVLAALLADADELAVLAATGHAGGLAAAGAHEHHVGHVNGRLDGGTEAFLLLFSRSSLLFLQLSLVSLVQAGNHLF